MNRRQFLGGVATTLAAIPIGVVAGRIATKPTSLPPGCYYAVVHPDVKKQICLTQAQLPNHSHTYSAERWVKWGNAQKLADPGLW
jgi:hypothetical protein